MKNRFITFLTSLSLLLSGCSLFNFDRGEEDQDEDEIKSFEFITDSSLAIEDDEYYVLTMYVGDTYQIKTNVDDKLDDKYHFIYENTDEPKYSVSSTGVVSANEKCVENFKVSLIRNKDNKKIDYDYIIINIKEETREYADITLSDETLDYDSSTRTYSLSISGGDNYQINLEIKYNVAYNKYFALSDTSYSSFMSVTSSGLLTTSKVSEDKDGQILIYTTSTDNKKIYDKIYLNVHITKEAPIAYDLEVIDQSSGSKITNGDKLTLYLNEYKTFSVKYAGENKYNVMSVSNTEVLSLHNSLNKITATKVGKSDVTFTYEDKIITIEVEVLKNTLLSIYSKNEGDDFVIINNNLVFLGRMFAKYQNGQEIDITKNSNLSYEIKDKSSTYKIVTFTFLNEDVSKTISYDVKFFTYEEEYIGEDVAYDLSDYFSNRYRGNYYVLPKEGNIHMLVIPIWFTNSTNFFKVSQQEEILTDLEYVYNGNRTKEEYYSVKQYYEIESRGKLTLDITISDFFESNTSSKAYGDTLEADIKRTHTLADDAINWYFSNNTNESISDYDANNDGLVDALSLVYAANYYGSIGDQNGTDAFQFKNTSGDDHKYNNGSFSPIGGIYGFRKSSTTVGKDVADLSMYYPNYFFASGGKTIIHETGHMFGMEDLYEDNHALTKYYPAGRFSMQSSNYGTHDPYQNNLVGWSKPQIYSASDYEVGDKITIKIDDFATSGNNIILTREHNEDNSLFDEYMILELLAPTGLNYYEANNSTTVGFKDAGIRLWHINSILEDMSASGKETTTIANDKWVNLKYSNNDQSSKYDLAHWIRNNKEEPFDTVSTVKNSYGLFKEGDKFDMESYSSQFVNPGKLDNKEKLGWEFAIDTIYQSVDDDFGAVITLTRVDNTRVDFDIESRLTKDIDTQPSEDGNDYASLYFNNDDLFSLVYNFNSATAPSYYTQSKPISYQGVCLFAEPNGNGGSLVLSIKDKDGYRTIINSVSITYTMLTNASPTAIVDGSEIRGTSFTGPHNDKDGYNENGMTYIVNSNSVIIQNKYTGGTDYHSVLPLYSIAINYHLEKI